MPLYSALASRSSLLCFDEIVLSHSLLRTGHMYQAFPTLMIQDASIAVMDSVLQGNDANQHLTLKMLALVHDVLQSQVDSAQAALVDSNKNDAKGGSRTPPVIHVSETQNSSSLHQNRTCRYGEADRQYIGLRRVWVSQVQRQLSASLIPCLAPRIVLDLRSSKDTLDRS
jgi:hypothetical protein